MDYKTRCLDNLMIFIQAIAKKIKIKFYQLGTSQKYLLWFIIIAQIISREDYKNYIRSRDTITSLTFRHKLASCKVISPIASISTYDQRNQLKYFCFNFSKTPSRG